MPRLQVAMAAFARANAVEEIPDMLVGQVAVHGRDLFAGDGWPALLELAPAPWHDLSPVRLRARVNACLGAVQFELGARQGRTVTRFILPEMQDSSGGELEGDVERVRNGPVIV